MSDLRPITEFSEGILIETESGIRAQIIEHGDMATKVRIIGRGGTTTWSRGTQVRRI